MTLTGAAGTLYTNLLMTGTPNSLSQLSGEGITASQNAAFASGRMFDSLMMDQGAFWRSGETADSEGVTFRAPLAYAPEKKKPAAFRTIQVCPKDRLTLPLADWKMRQSACEGGCWLVL
jgi:hypothetical protein